MALFDTNQGGGLFDSLPNIFMTPDFSQTGILTTDQQKELRNQATKAGLLGTALTYLATPKTENYGSALPYLAKAGLGGMNAAQDVYGAGLTNLYRQRLSEQKDDRLYNVDGALVDKEGKVVYQSPTKGKSNIGTINPSDVTPASLAKFAETNNYADLKFVKGAGGGLGLKDIYGEPQKDVNGNLVYIPKLPGYPARDMGGKPIVGNIELAEKEPKPPTEEQSKARTFYRRMEGATKVFNKPAVDKQGKPIISPDGTPLTIEQVAGKPEVGAEILGSIPLIGGVAKRGAESANRQLYRQAQENWVTANLRKESGAVIGAEEMQQEIKKYFPQINEGPEVIAQKAEARQIAEEGMKLNANFGKEKQPKQEQQAQQKRVIRTGKDKSGKTVIQYSDGSIEYGN
jgi:hypothetical protein